MRDKLNSTQCSQYLKALADPDRLKIVQCLQAGPLSVGDICRQLGAPLANVSHHLKQLRIAGLVQGQKKGRFVVYSLAEQVAKKPSESPQSVLEFGCCRIELGEQTPIAPATRRR